MAVPKNKTDDALLKNLVPLNTLSEDQLGQLLNRINIEKAKKGEYLFKEGDSDHQNIYLLAGTVALLSGQKEMDLVTSGTQTARFALAHQLPRKYSARAKSAVTYVRIDSRLLSDMLARSQTASYEVDEEESAEKGDWMSLLLRSTVFQQIPPSNLQRVMMRMEQVTVAENEVIINQGDDGDYFYLISSGKCRVTRQPDAGHPPVELAQLKAGQGFGEEALISDKPRSSTVTMITDGELVRLSKTDFVELVKQPLSQVIDYPSACKLAEENALWVDVRIPEEYEVGHLPGAINLPYYSIRFQTSSLADDRVYLLYGAEVGQSTAAAYLLIERGYDVYVLEEEWSALSAKSGIAPVSVDDHSDNVIDFNRDAGISEESEDSQTRSENEAKGEKLQELQNKLSTLNKQYESRVTQYQTEQKLLKQALAVAKRKLEIQEKNAEIAQQNHSDEVVRLQSELSEKESSQKDNETAHNDSERLYQEQLAKLEKQLQDLKQQYNEAEAEQKSQLRHERERADTYSERNIFLEEKLQSIESQAEENQKSANEAYDELVKQRDSLQRDFQELQTKEAAHLQEKFDEITSLKQELKNVQSESSQLITDKQTLQEERDLARVELDDLRATLEKETEQALSERNSLEEYVEKLKAEGAVQAEELDILRQSSDSAGAKYQAMIEGLKAELGQLQAVNSDLQKAQKVLMDEHGEIEVKLKEAISLENERAEGLEERLKSAEEEYKNKEDEYIETISKLEKEIETQQQNLQKEIENNSEKLQAAQTDLSEKLRISQENEEEQRKSIAGLHNKLENSEAEVQSITEALSEAKSELKQRDEKQHEQNRQLEEALQNVSFLQRSLATAEEAIDISENSLNEKDEDFKSLLDQLETLKTDNAELVRVLDDNKQTLNDKDILLQKTDQELHDIQEKLNQELRNVTSQLEKAREEELEKESVHKNELELVKAENTEQENKLTEIQRQLQEKISEHELTAKSQQQHIQELEQQLGVVREELAEAVTSKAEAHDSEQALKLARNEITQLNKTIDGLKEVQLEMETQLADDSAEEILKLRNELDLEAKKRRNAEALAKQADVLKRERDVQETAVEMLGEDIETLGQEKQELIDEKGALERSLSSLQEQFEKLTQENKQLRVGMSEFSESIANSQGMDEQYNEMREKLEGERDEALSQVDRLDKEVEELRGVIQAHVNEIQGMSACEDDSAALRTELEIVRHQASSDLEQLRSELATAKARSNSSNRRDMEEATSLQAQRQEIDSVRQALQEKDHMLKLSQNQCRKLEDSIEDRDKEVDQLKRKLELLIRKTGGMSDFTESVNLDSYTQSFAASTLDTDYLGEPPELGRQAVEKNPNGSRLGRIFRKK